MSLFIDPSKKVFNTKEYAQFKEDLNKYRDQVAARDARLSKPTAPARKAFKTAAPKAAFKAPQTITPSKVTFKAGSVSSTFPKLTVDMTTKKISINK